MIDWTEYVDALVDPVSRGSDETGEWFEKCAPDSPALHCWSVYMVHRDGTLLCVADCGSREIADYVARALAKNSGAVV